MTEFTVDALRDTLSLIEQAAPGTAAKAPRAQLIKTIAFLSEHEGKSIQDLVASLEAMKPPPKVAKAATGSKPKKPKLPVQMQVVELWVSKLRDAERALDDFAIAIASLKTDKQARLDEMKLIVSNYSGDSSAIKTKLAGLGVIQRAFDSRWNLRQHRESLAAHG